MSVEACHAPVLLDSVVEKVYILRRPFISLLAIRTLGCDCPPGVLFV